MTDLAPWLDIACPHADIRDGSFDESLFAADLGLVANGMGPDDYVDAELFAAKTYLTENLRSVLVEVGNRLSGDAGSAAVFRMQTEFGGGKTHTLLAAYHLFRAPEQVAGTQLGIDLAAALRTGSLPNARVAVLDGSALTVDPETMPDGSVVRSFLGHLAWRLGGAAAYETVRAKDEGLRGTSTVEMVKLLSEAAPCLILLDETLEYLNKALAVGSVDGNLAATTLTVIKELCTAASNVPGVAVVATLTSSRLEDYSTVAGQEMAERLSKVVGRIENIVTPVEGDDIFPILHTRLFETIGSLEQRQAVADAYGACYDQMGDVLPQSYRDPSYRDRIRGAYPFHPELIDLLTNRWGSLSGFQRTRGALRTLAHTVKALAQSNHQGLLIGLGDVPLADDGVRAEVIRFAGESYKSALNADIIRPDSKAAVEDERRGGEIKRNRVAVGLATTAFLNSFGSDRVLGASPPQMLVGVAQPLPGLSRGLLDDVRDALAGSLWYMRYEGGRYRFTTEPNLNKVIVEREGAVGDGEITALLRETVGHIAGPVAPFRVVTHVVEPNDVIDEPRLTLGVLAPHRAVGNQPGSTAVEADEVAGAVLNTGRGSSRSNKNALVLVAADAGGVTKARQVARTVVAMRDITRDSIRVKRFNQDQRDQLEARLSAVEERLPQEVVMAYRHLILLGPDGNGGVRVETVDLGPARVGDTICQRVVDHLKATDRLIDTTLAPAALLTDRFGVIGSDEPVVELDRLLDYFYRLPRLPKIASSDVLRRCLAQGVSASLFGLASGASWDAADAVLRFGEPLDPTEIQFQPGTWLARAADIKPLIEARRPSEESEEAKPTTGSEPEGETTPTEHPENQQSGVKEGQDPTRVTLTTRQIPADKIRDVVKVAIMPLAATGADVTINVEVTATHPDGIPHTTLDLTVAEGLRQLGLDHDLTK
ncbi:ATP-binding protein [Candidatus Poriferisocius sp.]|uniref:ATP-binding protein n=1 Tax=Candidatus Poriferisocius sp. TaxID=3101276 RepID=UPI003B5CFB72